MIRVNLVGRAAGGGKAARKAGRAPRVRDRQTNPLPVLWALVLLGTVAGGYLWWSSLTARSAQLAADIATAEAERARLQAVIDQDAIYEERKAEMERRIAAIEELQRNRVSPVVAVDMLSRAVEDTRYVWINSMSQANTSFNLNGAGNSIQAIETFITNLEATGYFTNINLGPLQQSGANYTFQIAMTFLPPLLPGQTAENESTNANLAGTPGPQR